MDNKNRSKKIVGWGMIAALMLISVAVFDVRYSATIHLYNERYKIRADSKFIDCRESAVKVGSKGALAVCESHYHDDGVGYADRPYITTIIYDSTDEVQLEPSQRSSQWKAALKVATKAPDKHAPFDEDMGYQVRKITDHYYDVYFDYELSPIFCDHNECLRRNP